jgi:hypothetical protein
MTKPTRLQALRAALARLRDEEQPPEHLVQAAIALHRQKPAAEVFRLRAAASESLWDGLALKSQSGLLDLDVFRARKSAETTPRRQFLLRVHPDHRAAFEGLATRIFARTDQGDRLLVDSIIRDGALMADVDLTGFDPAHCSAIVFVFEPADSK